MHAGLPKAAMRLEILERERRYAQARLLRINVGSDQPRHPHRSAWRARREPVKPSKSLLEKGFVYIRSERTDIKATFARIRAEQQTNNVKPINTKRGNK
jgi:hypothetical protein